MNGKGKVVCGAKKCTWFKSQYKPKVFICSKTLPLVKEWDVGACYIYYMTDPAATLDC